MQILVKDDDVRSARKANLDHGQLQPARESMDQTEFHELFQDLILKHQLSVLDFGGNETSWKVWQPETSTASLAVDPYFGKFIPALPFATVIPLWLATHDNYLWQNKKLMRCYMVGSWGVSTQASSHTHQLNWQSNILKFLFLLLSNWKKTKFWASWNKIT